MLAPGVEKFSVYRQDSDLHHSPAVIWSLRHVRPPSADGWRQNGVLGSSRTSLVFLFGAGTHRKMNLIKPSGILIMSMSLDRVCRVHRISTRLIITFTHWLLCPAKKLNLRSRLKSFVTHSTIRRTVNASWIWLKRIIPLLLQLLLSTRIVLKWNVLPLTKLVGLRNSGLCFGGPAFLFCVNPLSWKSNYSRPS